MLAHSTNSLSRSSWRPTAILVSFECKDASHKTFKPSIFVDCVLWRHPILLHTKDTITAPLSSMHTETMQPEAIKLFKVSASIVK